MRRTGIRRGRPLRRGTAAAISATCLSASSSDSETVAGGRAVACRKADPMRTRIGLGLVCALAVATTAASTAATASASVARIDGGPISSDGAARENVPAFRHVFLIIGENTTYSHLTTTNAPYLLRTIKPRAAWLTNYYAATHWSQANYVPLVTGQFTRCKQKDGGIACHQNIDNLYHQLDQADLTWRVWLEAGTAKCDTGSGGSCSSNTPCPLSGFYTTGNPPILFDDIEGPGGVWSPDRRSRECLANDIPAGTPQAGTSAFNADLAT